jgi:hypothetical protein
MKVLLRPSKWMFRDGVPVPGVGKKIQKEHLNNYPSSKPYENHEEASKHALCETEIRMRRALGNRRCAKREGWNH